MYKSQCGTWVVLGIPVDSDDLTQQTMTHHGASSSKSHPETIGKTRLARLFCGESLERDFGYCFHDGDQWLPEDLRETFKARRILINKNLGVHPPPSSRPTFSPGEKKTSKFGTSIRPNQNPQKKEFTRCGKQIIKEICIDSSIDSFIHNFYFPLFGEMI